MHIGELAHIAAVNIQTIRFYERQGLLPVPLRNEAGYRCYNQSDVERVRFIKRNQEIGFTLLEIGQLLALHSVVATVPLPIRRKPAELHNIVAIGRERLGNINQKIRTLNAMKRQLTYLVQQLEKATVVSCPAAERSRRLRD
jgi:DNA-binding transcriptional MerR regulator